MAVIRRSFKVKNRVFLVETLGLAELKEALRRGCQQIVYCSRQVELPSEVEGVDATPYRVDGCRWAYDWIIRHQESLFEKHPEFKNSLGINWTNPVRKAAYWPLAHSGRLVVAAEKAFGVKIDPLVFGKRSWRSYLGQQLRYLGSFFWGLDSTFNKKKSAGKQHSIPHYLFVANAPLVLTFYQKILKKMRGEIGLYIPLEGANKWTNEEIEAAKKEFPIVILESGRKTKAKRFGCRARDLNDAEKYLLFIQSTMHSRAMILISQWKELFADGVKCVLFSAGENVWCANVICQIAAQSGATTINMMNGMKYGAPNDRDVEFTKWIVWDERMRERLVERAGLESERLETIGHPNEDEFLGMIPENREKVEVDGKIRISVFGSPQNTGAKQELIDALTRLGSDGIDLQIIYRPHPREAVELRPTTLSKLFKIEKNLDDKKSLFNLLYWSDLVVVFGSTVALEAKWLKKPVISIEPWLESFLYFIDGETTIHLRAVADFPREFLKMKKRLKLGQTPRPTIDKKVGTPMDERYTKFIRQISNSDG